jgi:hypothetical protein
MKTIFTLLVLACLAGEIASAAPRIEFDHTTCDLGTTSGAQSVTGSFVVRNTGDEPLIINGIGTSCGCTRASVEKKEIAPGASTPLSFSINLGDTTGLVVSSLTLGSNDPVTPRATLTCRVKIPALYEAAPRDILLGDIGRGELTNVTVEVRRLDGAPLVISETAPSRKTIKATVEPVNNDPSRACIRVKFPADTQLGRFNESLKIHTDDPVKPSLTIWITGRVVGDVIWSPAVLFWSLPGSGGTVRGPAAERKVVVSAPRLPGPFTVRNVTSTVDRVTVELRALEQDRKYEIVATLSDPPPKTLMGMVAFETNAESQPTIAVPVTIQIGTPHK